MPIKNELPSVDSNQNKKPKAANRIPMVVEVLQPTHRIQELDRVRMDVRPLSKLQRVGLVELTSGLIEQKATLENGTEVKRQSHAIKWVLEQFGVFAEN